MAALKIAIIFLVPNGTYIVEDYQLLILTLCVDVFEGILETPVYEHQWPK